MRPAVKFLLTAAVVALATTAALRCAALCRRSNAPVSVRFLAMGTLAEVSFRSGDAAAGADIVRAAFQEVESAASVFLPDSVLSRLNRAGLAIIPPTASEDAFDLASLLSAALDVSRESGGAFDPTVNPLMRLWGFRSNPSPASPPSTEALSNALSRVGWFRVGLSRDQDGSTKVAFARPGMELDLGGIAKGAAVDLAFERLRAAGFRDFLVNLGGNIRVSGSPSPLRRSWRVAVRDPGNPAKTLGEPLLLTSGEAVATSGSYERFVEIAGARFSHIIDPRSGLPAPLSGSVTVVAPTATEADAWSTALFVQGAGHDGAAVVRRHASTPRSKESPKP